MEQWKSFKDVAKWLDENFEYDKNRLEESERSSRVEKISVPVKTVEETFQSKKGICMDSVLFTKEVLNRINSSYKAEVVFLKCRPEYKYDHYVCKFELDGKIYIMDYGNSTSNKHMNGIHGPYKSLDGYKEYYEKNNFFKKKVSRIQYGWPSYRQKQFEKE